MRVASANTDAGDADPMSGVVVSLLFWLMLLAAAVLFAVVSLSPKLSTYLLLSDQQRTQQYELVELERQHAELERVIAALKDDPQFAAEMARMEFDAVRPGEEILSVESSLALSPAQFSSALPARPVTASAWRPWLKLFAESHSLRTGLLICAAVLVLLAFGWMHDSPADGPATA